MMMIIKGQMSLSDRLELTVVKKQEQPLIVFSVQYAYFSLVRVFSRNTMVIDSRSDKYSSRWKFKAPRIQGDFVTSGLVWWETDSNIIYLIQLNIEHINRNTDVQSPSDQIDRKSCEISNIVDRRDVCGWGSPKKQTPFRTIHSCIKHSLRASTMATEPGQVN